MFFNKKEENYLSFHLPKLPYAYDALEPYCVKEGKKKLVGILQQKYGYSKDKAQEEYNKFIDDNE